MIDLSEHPLYPRLLESPDDPAPYLVLGDDLLHRGDPRGTLIALMAAGREPDANKLLFEEPRLLGVLYDAEHPWEIDWFCGLARALHLHGSGECRRAAEIIEDFGQRGLLGLLRELRVVGTANADRVMHAMRPYEWPLLGSLALGTTNLQGGRCDVPLHDLGERFPALRTLRAVRVRPPIDHPGLTHLALNVQADVLGDLATSELPSLEHLELRVEGVIDPRALLAVTDRPLRRLAIHGEARHVFLEHLDQLSNDPDELVLDEPFLDVHTDPLWVSPRQLRLRRFERATGETVRFWEIVREGHELHIRYGKRGARGTRRTRGLGSSYQAARDYRERVLRKREEGWNEVWVD